MIFHTAAIDFRCESPALRPLGFDRFERVLVARCLSEVSGVIAEAEAYGASGGYAVGFVAYEAAAAFDPALCSHLPDKRLPLALFALAPRPTEGPPATGGGYDLGAWRPGWTAERYGEAFARVLEHIARGDTYQVNLTFPLETEFRGDPLGCYRTLLSAQRGNFCGCLLGDEISIVSASPELFFARCGRTITTRPMKGTERRGRTTAQDADIARHLRASEKQRAENLMIVDLLRNDLGRVCAGGSVKVVSCFDVERYPTVWQMTSTVRGELEAETSLAAIFRAIFPCGSVTGAPKVMTSRIIRSQESGPRGVYCGAFGVILPGGDCVFNVPIRTLQLFHPAGGGSAAAARATDREGTAVVAGAGAARGAVAGEAVYHVGSGVVADSDPRGEYDESLLKAEVLTRAADRAEMKLLETLLWHPACGYWLEAEHLERLTDSADYFDYAIDAAATRAALVRRAELFTAPRRVRLLLDRTGGIEIEDYDFTPAPGFSPSSPSLDEPVDRVAVRLAARPIDIATPLVYHKTTRRGCYDAFRAELAGAFDMLLHNPRGELTEGTITTVAVKLDGRWATPPVDCGLLAGTLRRRLLAEGKLTERVVRLDELAAAEGLRVFNGLRGVMKAEILK